MERSDFPEVGTRLTYGETIPAYNRFERSMLEKAYGAGLLPAVGCTTCSGSLNCSHGSSE